MSLLAIWMPLITLAAGLIGGGVGAYIGMKIGLTRLEVWKEIAADAIHKLQGDSVRNGDDILILDTEMGYVMSHANMKRVSRMRARG